MSASKPDKCLHLFTSTIRPLYISDALDILASPTGSITRFRYEQTYVEETVRDRWSTKDSLVDSKALVHFAIQHPAEYHLPSYIPVREAKVVGNFVEGKTYVVNFEVGPIRLAATTRQVVDHAAKSSDIGGPVVAYSDALRKALKIKDPPRPFALIDAPQEELLEPAREGNDDLEVSQAADFERAVKVFAQALYFSPRIFYRVARFNTHDHKSTLQLQEGRLVLTAGQRYEVAISHYQAQPPPDGSQLTVSVPDGVTLIGDANLPLASRYDVIPLEIYAEFRDDRTEGLFEIGVVAPALGPSVRVPIVIKPSKAASVVAPSAAIAAGVGTAVASVLASQQAVKIGLVAGGTALAGAAIMYRRNRHLS